ncbi:MAG: DUF3155 domain-containing protein [Hormoscilla sp. SP12CHS1]|nr:DUF3155 domain-containing protein [Hormoscilla sp. SP12CHS1]
MARRRKRKSRRRLEGRRILEQVAHYHIETGEDKPVTAARKYIRAQGIVPPALLLVKRNEHTTDRYFWAEKGLFGAQYVEENHFLFPSLKEAEQKAQIAASAAIKAQAAIRLSGSTEILPNVSHLEAQNPPISFHSQ